MEHMTMVMDCILELVDSGYASSWPKLTAMDNTVLLPTLKTGDGDKVPFITATGVRGALRRHAMNTVSELTGEKIRTPRGYFFNAVGGIRGRKADSGTKEDGSGEKPKETQNDGGESTRSLRDLRRAREMNPILGLFGAGDVHGSFMGGHLYVGNAVPMGTPHVGVYRGSRSDDTNNRGDMMLEVTDPETFDATAAEYRRLKEQRSKLKADIKKLENEQKAAKKAGTELPPEKMAHLKDLKQLDEQDSTVSVQQPLPGFQYLAPCTLRQRIVLRDVTDIEIGLFLKALDRMMKTDPYLGAHRARGFGGVAAEGSVKLIEEGGKTEFKIEAVPFEGLVCDKPEILQRFFSALENHAASGLMTLAEPGSAEHTAIARAA